MEGDRHRQIVTGMLILVWVAMGLNMEIGGPTMLDLRLRFQANSGDIARSVSAAGAGIFLGALIAGLFVDGLAGWKCLLVTFAQILSSLVIICMPFVGNLSVMWFLFFTEGACVGITNVAGQRMLLELWKSKAPGPLHAMHMGFGIGAVSAPLIANNFLAVLDFSVSKNSTINGTNSDTSSDFIVVKESRVEYAYVTIGLVAGFISFPFIVYPFYLCYTKRYQQNSYANLEGDHKSPASEKLTDLLNPGSYADGSKGFGTFVFLITFLYYVNVVGGEQLFGNFVRTFSVDQLKFSRNEASYLDTAYWGCFTLGRLTGSVLSHCLPIQKLFVLDVVINLVAVTFLDIFSARNHATLWGFTGLVGFVVAPLYPACLSYANTQIEIGGIVLTLVVFATGFGDFLYIWVAGALYQSHGPRTVLYGMQASAILVFIITMVFVCATYRRGNRFEKRSSDMQMMETSPVCDTDDSLSSSYSNTR